MNMLVPSALTATLMLPATIASSDPLTCNLTGYKATPGLTATGAGNSLTVIEPDEYLWRSLTDTVQGAT